ncbi:hypothetical protein SAMN05421749_102461 [Acinetobacter marinus]|uniref:Lipoprotein n=1 Tax=Acinetobacter marinus TaxID=281375 RepID=A0A1G6HSM1_9GAMM|nr:hypothetical protein [Acinetobacter marinus]SDB96855.1 hypothetical protein SAMN05421749_102461 [Acinetobacter marinus]
MKKILTVCILALAGSGCATSALMNDTGRDVERTVRETLIKDTVVAFAQPAKPIQDVANDNVVIVGQQYSYLLTQGGKNFVNVLRRLDAKNIKVDNELAFLSEKNDGTFKGTLPLTYVALKEDISKDDLNFFIEYDAKECSNYSDKQMKAQRFCLNIPLSGVIYPQARNIASLNSNLQHLSKPYHVSIYTEKKQKEHIDSRNNPAKKLVLLPFAVAFDVITSPFQVAAEIFD